MTRSAPTPSAAPLALLGALALAALTGCNGLIPLTHELRTQNDLSRDELKNLQFYTSDTITLRRELESGGKQITGNHKLRITEGTVKNHVSNILSKLGVRDRTRAVLKAFELGIV